MKLAIVGSRTFNTEDNFGLMIDILTSYLFNAADRSFYFDTIISGGAKGADSFAKQFASDFEIEYVEFKADWNTNGKSAGMIRNKLIVDACDMVLVFWDGESRGTKNTIDLAKAAKKPTFIIYV
jgi:predicted Rossmann fold nucleotide-binding protein DprA/Smf involved in DNA uptake